MLRDNILITPHVNASAVENKSTEAIIKKMAFLITQRLKNYSKSDDLMIPNSNPRNSANPRNRPIQE